MYYIIFGLYFNFKNRKKKSFGLVFGILCKFLVSVDRMIVVFIRRMRKLRVGEVKLLKVIELVRGEIVFDFDFRVLVFSLVFLFLIINLKKRREGCF